MMNPIVLNALGSVVVFALIEVVALVGLLFHPNWPGHLRDRIRDWRHPEWQKTRRLDSSFGWARLRRRRATSWWIRLMHNLEPQLHRAHFAQVMAAAGYTPTPPAGCRCLCHTPQYGCQPKCGIKTNMLHEPCC